MEKGIKKSCAKNLNHKQRMAPRFEACSGTTSVLVSGQPKIPQRPQTTVCSVLVSFSLNQHFRFLKVFCLIFLVSMVDLKLD